MENNKIQGIYTRLTNDQAFAEELKKFVENKNIASPEEEAAAFIEFAKLFLNQKLHVFVYVHLSANYVDLHFVFQPFFRFAKGRKSCVALPLDVFSITHFLAFVKSIQKMFTFRYLFCRKDKKLL